MTDASEVFVVDADGHVIEPQNLWSEYVEKKYQSRTPRPTFDEHGTFCFVVDDTLVSRTASRLGNRPDRAEAPADLRPGGWDPEKRLADMDSEGIDLVFLYPSVAFFMAEVPDVELQRVFIRAYNNWLADYCKAAPDRLVGIALLPLSDIAASIQELKRCTNELGFRGAFIRPNPYNRRPIQHPAYKPFWECAESLGVPITVHEGISDTLPTLGRERTGNPAYQHLMSHPFEQMAACAGVILGGVTERHPNLNFVFLESGCGWLPYWLQRMDGHFGNWPHHFRKLKMKPSEYFQRQCFISMDPDDEIAPSVIAEVGDNCMVWASDYPHTDHPFPGTVKSTLDILGRVSKESTRKVLGTNAFRLYGMDTPPRARGLPGTA